MKIILPAFIAICMAAYVSAQTAEQEYQFMVEISGVNAGYFKGVDGLSAELEVIEFQDGDDLFLRKRPGRAKFGNITLKRGIVEAKESKVNLRAWFDETIHGALDSRDVSISMVDAKGVIVDVWELYGCWPKQWKINGLDGKGNDVVTEEITFAVEEIRF